jgi:signal transduction histidine kinase/CheY-like chemotaxis protein
MLSALETAGSTQNGPPSSGPSAAENPPASLRLESLRRELLPRQMQGAMTAGVVMWGLFAAGEALEGHRLATRIDLLFGVLSAVMLVAIRRWPRAIRPLSHLGLLVTAAGIVMLASVTGQTFSPALWFLLGLPLYAGFLFGLRAAGLWTAGVLLLMLGVEACRRFYPITPEFVIGPMGYIVRMVGLALLLVVLSLATNRVHQAQIELLEQREATIGELAEGLAQKTCELEVARDAALAASRAKSDFLAMMSHEIRTPLNGVLGLTGVLLDAQLPIEQREIVRTIRSSGDALLLLLNDLLDFSKIEAGGLTLEKVPFSLVDCAEDAIDLFAAAAVEKGIDLYFIASPAVPAQVEGDSARIRQILVNLISNALKFTVRGEIEVRLDAEPDKGGDPAMIQLHCSVRDTGIGIPEDMKSRLFKPFSQLDPSTTRRFGGTGLGLAICRTLAERMNGGISAESTAGHGSTFHVHFPAKVLAVDGVSGAGQLGAGRTAVVVTAREGARAAVVSQIASLGFRTVDASTCAEAAQRLAKGRADLVIAEEPSDVAELRSLLGALRPPPPLVLLTAGKLESPARAALRERWSRAVPIVGMPVRRAVLRDATARALDPGTDPPPLSNPAPIAETKPLRILVAEDNPVNQRVALLLLEQLGYRADVAGNGAEAIEALHDRSYDVVFMDVRMPEVDGLEATRTIRKTLPRERQPRIIALTANAMVEDRAACAAAGMDDFLPKPLVLPTLEKALREHPSVDPAADEPDHGARLDVAKVDALRELTADQPGLLSELLRDYFSAAERLIAQMQGGLETGDAPAVMHAAHSLKGGSGQMGAALVMKESERVERLARQGDLDQARAALSLLIEEQERAKTSLCAVLGEPA